MSDYSLFFIKKEEMRMSVHPPIQVERVSKRFGKKVVIDDVSLEVQTGEIFGLLGPSGAGKTTLVRMIAGIDQRVNSALGNGRWLHDRVRIVYHDSSELNFMVCH